MTLGAWIFAAVVLVLVVINAPFRKFFLRAAGVLAILAVVAGLGWYVWDKHEQHVAEASRKAYEAEHQKLVDACVARFGQVEKMADVFTKVACEENPDAQPQPQPVALDFSKSIPVEKAKPKPKPEPTNYEVRVNDGSYVKDGRREQGYVEYKCVNTDTGEVNKSVEMQVSPSWEVVRDPMGAYEREKQFADFESADAYAKRTITTACKKWVAK
jgi:hypothetical protein